MLDFSYILKEQVFVKFQLMISSFSQEQFQKFYEFSGGGRGITEMYQALYTQYFPSATWAGFEPTTSCLL